MPFAVNTGASQRVALQTLSDEVTLASKESIRLLQCRQIRIVFLHGDISELDSNQVAKLKIRAAGVLHYTASPLRQGTLLCEMKRQLPRLLIHQRPLQEMSIEIITILKT